MNSFISKAVTFVITLLLLAGSVLPVQAAETAKSDTAALAKPVLSEIAVFSGKFELALGNAGKYAKGTKFEIWVDGEKTSSTTIEKLADKGYVFNICGGKSYFAPKTKHSVKVKAVTAKAESAFSAAFTATTKKKTVYYAAAGRTYYKLKNGKLTKAGTLSEAGYFTAVLSDANGKNCEGRNTKTNTAKYILITEGSFKNCYISVSEVRRKTEEQLNKAAPVKPVLSEAFISADKLGVKIGNLSKYREGTVFNVYVNDAKLKTVKLAAIKRDGYISVYTDAVNNLKSSTSYLISVEPVSRQLTSRTDKLFMTGDTTYFRLKNGTALYTLSGGKFTAAGSAEYDSFGEGERVTAKGKAIAGRNAKSYKGEYVKLTSGDYKGKYVKASAVGRITKEDTAKYNSRQAKIDKVVAYAKANVGGAYVSCGTRYRATDCSGLTMLAYQQIGVSLPHSAYGQMCLGRQVSASAMQPGDIIISNGYNHAMMYVGSGMVVHAMNSRDGIRMQAASTAMYYNPVNAIVRII